MLKGVNEQQTMIAYRRADDEIRRLNVSQRLKKGGV